ncbi:4Fe-4S dicluster domain-containing protein [Lysobacter soli]|uniref:(Fe-S)-binding protein n=1 Tax=Lysobacter soli TaxID=453783 RepID=UPI0012ED3195|nr:(Fe-S)-binding protein [Lysobacter soli]QGW64041.1 4Fe-4S dicluster domain-containing protein [Lysobacter soli]
MPPADPSPRHTHDPLVALADRCVQCGLCLPACPTYAESRLEAESPRGRIALARAWALETIPPTPAGETHLDQCLGCRSCEAVCPAGVQYGALLVQARSRQRERRSAGWRQKSIEALVARPALLGALLRAYGRVHAWLPAQRRLLPPPAIAPPAVTAFAPAEESVAMFVGCAASAYEAGLRESVARCLAMLGVRVETPSGQTCCGSVHAHAGDIEGAQRLAARNRGAFESTRTVLTFASGCHEAVAQALDGGTTRTVDAIEFLARRLQMHGERWQWRARPERIALQLPCTQRNVVRSAGTLRALLASVPGVEIVELTASGCCGASGAQMLENPARAATFRAPLLRQLQDSGATRLLSANLGCRLHLANGTSVPVQHPLEFLAECVEAAPSPQAISPSA